MTLRLKKQTRPGLASFCRETLIFGNKKLLRNRDFKELEATS